MDVVRLNSSYLPDSLVEGYSVMIWTERYSGNSEFELRTSKIAETRALLPELSLISLLDSSEVMIVETHEIDRKTDKVELVIRGRSFETFLENRIMASATYKNPWSTYKQYKASEFASLLLWNHLVNTTGQDPTRTGVTQDSLTGIPSVVITDSSVTSDAAKAWWIDEGVVYPLFKNTLDLMQLGVRNIRPANTTGNVMTFDTSGTASRGAVTKTSTPGITQLRVDVYNGVDRSRNQSSVEPIIFHYDSGHIDNPKYLFSSKELKHMARITSSAGALDVWPDTTPPPNTSVSGLSRRTLYVDGGNVGPITFAEATPQLQQKARIELMKHNRAIIFDGAISPVSPYKYNKQYFLGDKVTLLAEYGIEATMFVAEYIRTEDHSGDRGYPTLVLAS